MKILLTSSSFYTTPGYHHELLAQTGYQVDYKKGPLKEEELLPVIAEYDAVLCGDDEYTEKVLATGKAGKLKAVSKYGIGLDKIDLAAARQLEIPVKNCPGVNKVSVAEHVFALLLTFSRNIHKEHEATLRKQWPRTGGEEIMGKTMGIIGLGNIGKEVAKRAAAWGLQVIAYEKQADPDFITSHPVTLVDDMASLLRKSDIISLHLPLTQDTRNIITTELLDNVKENGVVIINTARGGLLSTHTIRQGLASGKIRGYLTDVLEEEPMSAHEELAGLEGVIITSHIGSKTRQNVERQGEMAIQNLVELLEKYSG